MTPHHSHPSPVLSLLGSPIRRDYLLSIAGFPPLSLQIQVQRTTLATMDGWHSFSVGPISILFKLEA